MTTHPIHPRAPFVGAPDTQPSSPPPPREEFATFDRTEGAEITILTAIDLRDERRWTLISSADGQDIIIPPNGQHIDVERILDHLAPIAGTPRAPRHLQFIAWCMEELA